MNMKRTINVAKGVDGSRYRKQITVKGYPGEGVDLTIKTFDDDASVQSVSAGTYTRQSMIELRNTLNEFLGDAAPVTAREIILLRAAAALEAAARELRKIV